MIDFSQAPVISREYGGMVALIRTIVDIHIHFELWFKELVREYSNKSGAQRKVILNKFVQIGQFFKCIQNIQEYILIKKIEVSNCKEEVAPN